MKAELGVRANNIYIIIFSVPLLQISIINFRY